MTGDSEVKVIDFGLAKAITDAGAENGSDARRIRRHNRLCQPEQFGGAQVDAARTSMRWAARSGLRSPAWHRTLARRWRKFAIVKRTMACRSRN